MTPLPSLPTVQLSVGPMARDVDSLALCMKALLCEDLFRLDSTIPPLPFREEVSEDRNGQGEGTLELRWCRQDGSCYYSYGHQVAPVPAFGAS